MTPILTGIIASGISGHLTPPWEPEGAYDALAYVTVGSGGASSISFTGIPLGYKHLQIRNSYMQTSGGQNVTARFNGDTGANYSYHNFYADGAGSAGANGSGGSSVMYCGYSQVNTTYYTSIDIIDILDYSNTNKYKTMKSLSGSDANGSGLIRIASGSWQSVNPVETITITSGADFAQHSTFALYGVK